MMGTNLISNILVYNFFAHSLYQQIDQRLNVLADSAAHSLGDIKKDEQALYKNNKRSLDYDHDLDLSWQSLQQSTQSIEWFNEHQQFLGRSGKINISHPLVLGFLTLNQKPPIRLLMIPVYEGKSSPQRFIIGYVRVAESTEAIYEDLHYLFWGFSLGMVITLMLISFGGIWLTQKALQPLAQSYEQLKQFTGDASHELRSPLTAIKTSVEVLKSHPERIHPQDVGKLDSIFSATNQMSDLVEDLLLLARTDNDLDLGHQDFLKIPLEELLEDVITFLEPEAEQKEISIQFYRSNSGIVLGNPSHLQRLFNNILENAIKYTPIKGQVNIKLRCDDKWAIVMIEDTGIGINQEELPFVFERFWRSEKARAYKESNAAYKTKGTGLGLAIAKSLAKANGGEIKVKSRIGAGTCFTVLLPIAF